MYTVGNDKNIVNIKAPHDKKADEVVRVKDTSKITYILLSLLHLHVDHFQH